MTDDPRAILKAAGVECAEVDDWQITRLWASDMNEEKLLQAKLTILTLARLVAKYKWQRDEAVDDWRRASFGLERRPFNPVPLHEAGYLADLDRRWEEHDD